MKKIEAPRQQGDVFVYLHEGKIEKDMEKLKHQTLAEGEVTGHAHRVTVGDAVLYRNAEKLVIDVLSDIAVVTHEEHGPLALPKGTHKVKIVQEYDHFAEEAKQVAD